MKKISILLLFFIIIPAIFLFSWCVPTEEEVAGTYKLVEVYDEEKTYKVGETFKNKTLTPDSAILVLNNDENMSASYNDLDFGSEIIGKWEKKENTIIFTSTPIKSIELNFQLKKDGDLFLMIENESVLLLEKINEE